MLVNIEMAPTDVFKPITDLFESIVPVISNNPYLWYTLYFFGFGALIFTVVNSLAQKTKFLNGKSGKAVSWLVTIITLGSIFYGVDVKDLINNVDTFTKTIASLIIGIGAMIFTFKFFNNNKSNENSRFAYIVLFVGLSLSSSMLAGVLGPTGYVADVWGLKVDLLYSILVLIQAIAMIGLLGYVVVGLVSILRGRRKRKDAWSDDGGKVNQQNIGLLTKLRADLIKAIENGENSMVILKNNLPKK